MEAIGPVLILFSLPLIFRWVPPNRYFGLRIPSTLKSRSVWYDANALNGRHLFILSVVQVCLEVVMPQQSGSGGRPREHTGNCDDARVPSSRHPAPLP